MTQTIVMDADTALAQAIKQRAASGENHYLVLKDSSGRVMYSGEIFQFSWTPGGDTTVTLRQTEQALAESVALFADSKRAEFELRGLL
ncbi:hypothetical protein SSEA_SKINNY_66 [Mycobacterium phage Skinny]|uniref:Uncharacterized protein n=4 Tax=Bongovirus bongo TaxID=1983750 RepID=A0A514DJ60_9CAUD|nr:hypothetical protein FDH95_gp064 [Mycobacterium phage Bongo]AXQ52705.1 hypothetical protein SEA_IPHANE7_64 [Mycobacterium phage IPhane7]QDH93637.1 hypothetical protein SEA_LILHOMIEP_63 [Mycobacterium phage LilhomieP]QGJ93211.1 hypothetical protein SEA_TYDAWG_64 [Mycobacterium phage TyDawg]QUU29264.1 hypothetical protein [Mycobacterium phage SirSheldon]UXE05268.1 hypothetical protein SSEA_SKINNY_66 [Mycobacterium phage Skinny]WMI33244.1 hypothetical protein SEA_SLIMJIMMY_63 [Mycobacterium p